jgi:glycerol uptake facilitator-like aquaporin
MLSVQAILACIFKGLMQHNPCTCHLLHCSRVNGLALAVWVYAAANISGGHLNPVVTCSTLLAGFYPLLHSLTYIALQICGGMVGALLVVGLMPQTYIGIIIIIIRKGPLSPHNAIGFLPLAPRPVRAAPSAALTHTPGLLSHGDT